MNTLSKCILAAAFALIGNMAQSQIVVGLNAGGFLMTESNSVETISPNTDFSSLTSQSKWCGESTLRLGWRQDAWECGIGIGVNFEGTDHPDPINQSEQIFSSKNKEYFALFCRRYWTLNNFAFFIEMHPWIELGRINSWGEYYRNDYPNNETFIDNAQQWGIGIGFVPGIEWQITSKWRVECIWNLSALSYSFSSVKQEIHDSRTYYDDNYNESTYSITTSTVTRNHHIGLGKGFEEGAISLGVGYTFGHKMKVSK